MNGSASHWEFEAEGIALVKEEDSVLPLSDPAIKVESVCDRECRLRAILDTGSPVSFIKYNVYTKWILLHVKKLESSNRIFVNLKNAPLNIVGVVLADLTLDFLKNKRIGVNLFVIKEYAFDSDIILGRKFIKEQKLTLCYMKPTETNVELDTSKKSLSNLPLYIEDEKPETLEQILNNLSIDFGNDIKKRVVDMILEIEEKSFEPVEDGYAIEVHLKDDSIFAYASRRFAHVECN